MMRFGEQRVAVGEELPSIELAISFGMVVGQVAGTRDIYPGHHDPRFARAQGQQDIYLNTVFYQAFVDRLAMGWAGPGWTVARRFIRIVSSTYPGDMLVGTGIVAGVDQELGHAPRAVEIDIELRARGEVVVIAQVELRIIGARDAT